MAVKINLRLSNTIETKIYECKYHDDKIMIHAFITSYFFPFLYLNPKLKCKYFNYYLLCSNKETSIYNCVLN